MSSTEKSSQPTKDELDLDELFCQVGSFLDDSMSISIGLVDLNREDATKLRDWLNEVLSR